VLNKLIELSDAAEFLSDKVTETEQGIASARARLTGGFRKQTEYDDLRATLKQMVDDLPVLRRRCHVAQSTYSACQVFLDQLPDDATLEPVTIHVDGHDLEEVRAKLEAAKAELAALRAVPTPAPDIRQRIEDYVRGVSRPTITGMGNGERLKVIWPGAGWDTRGPIEDRADVLPLMALLHGDAMVAALMREVEANVPIKERATRIAALTDEIEQLAYIEEALIARGEDVQRSPNALPEAVLQVRVAEAVKTSCAA
jgi:hypothetical protein